VGFIAHLMMAMRLPKRSYMFRFKELDAEVQGYLIDDFCMLYPRLDMEDARLILETSEVYYDYNGNIMEKLA